MSVLSIVIGTAVTCGGLLALISVLEMIPSGSGKKAPKKEAVISSELDALWLASTIRTDVVLEKVAADKRANQAKLDLIKASLSGIESEVNQLARALR